MDLRKLNLLIVLLALPFLAMGQIPKGHFLDSDGKIKPFKQNKKGVYHYAILSGQPFENDCPKRLSQKKKITCVEDSLSELLRNNLNLESDYKGRVYIYLTVTEAAEIVDIDVTSYPNSDEINRLVENATKQIPVKSATYKDNIVKARLWTFLALE